MKRREFNMSLAAATVVGLSPFSLARKARAATGGGGATLVFNYTSFANSPSTIRLANNSLFNGSVIQLLPTGSSHLGCGAYYTSALPPNSFTTQFTFQPQGLGSSVVQSGFVFVVQNTVSPPVNSGGLDFGGDANMCGYGGAINQFPPVDAIAIKFDAGDQSVGQNYPSGGLPSSTGLYFNQGPAVYPGGSLGLCPCNDLNPYGINFYTNNTYQVTIVYDGSLLTMTILDTTSNAQARFVWPLNLANTTNANANYIGFSAGRSSTGYYNIKSWSYYTGYNTRLATPTFSPSPGNYTSAQTVALSYPAGSACYYTTNGLLPTSSSTLYTDPITVSANQVIQAVAIQAGSTDSLVAAGNYVIGTSSNVINFPSGFAAGDLVPVGYAYSSGSTYRVTDTNGNTAGAVWFPVPVTVSTFSTTFTLDLVNGAQGMCFVIQNNPQPYVALSGVQITGTTGQISFNAVTTPLSVGQYVTIAGTLGGTGSIGGYANPTTYIVGATNGTTTATLCAAGVLSPSQSGTTFHTVPQTLVAGDAIVITGNSPIPGGTYYVLSSGLTSTTCELSSTPGGTAVSVGSSLSCTFAFVTGSGGGGATLTTTVGTPSGLTFSVNAPNWSGGPTVVGAPTQALGYGGINAVNGTPGQSFGLLNSVALAFSQYAIGSDPSNGVGLYTNGADPYGSQVPTGLTFNTTFNVTLTYNGSTLSLSMQATNGGTIFTRSWTINIPSTVGANTAYVGFTGGSGGGAHAVQAIQSWTYTAASSVQAPPPAAAVPAAPTNLQVK